MNREELGHAVLTAALRLPPARCSTRGIAEELGVSQSTVSRFWRTHLRDSPASARLADLARSDRLVLAAVSVTPTGSSLLFRRLPSGGTQRLGAPSQAFLGRWRAVLGAELLRPVIAERAGSAEQEEVRAERFATAVEAVGTEGLVVTTLPDDGSSCPGASGTRPGGSPGPRTGAPGPRTGAPGPRTGAPVVLRTADAGEWAGLISALGSLPENLAAEAMADVVARLQHWNRHVDGTFSWVDPALRRDLVPAEGVAPGSLANGVAANGTLTNGADAASQGTVRPRAPRGPRSAEEQILRGVQAGLARGEYVVGEEISAHALAKRLGMAVSRVRRGITALQDQGLVGVRRGAGVSIQLPSRDDIAELYAARNALGTLAVRAAARRTDLDPTGLAALLDLIRTAVRDGDSPQVQRLDARFQIELAHVSGMARVPSMLESFHEQMVLYISVFGVDYAYPVQEVLEGDRVIAAAVGAGDQAKAVQAWRQKMDAGAAYMLQLIGDTEGTSAAGRHLEGQSAGENGNHA